MIDIDAIIDSMGWSLDASERMDMFRLCQATLKAASSPQPTQQPSFCQVYRAKLKSRKQMEREIPPGMRGWWFDVSAGCELRLRQATQSDLDRCTLADGQSRNPDDYMCEIFERGSLVSKIAIEFMNAERNVFAAAPQPARQLDQWLDIDSAPQDGRTILLGYHNSHGNWRTMRGQWFTKERIDEDWENADCADAGWYETSVEADDVPSCWPTNPTH